MKLIIAGASGFVATEAVRQSLNDPKITSVIALARRQIVAPADLASSADASKLKSITSDYGGYSEDVKRLLADADACIWYSRHHVCSCSNRADVILPGQSPSHLVSRKTLTSKKSVVCVKTCPSRP
jgi:hypothetical protein